MYLGCWLWGWRMQEGVELGCDGIGWVVVSLLYIFGCWKRTVHKVTIHMYFSQRA